MVRRHCQLERTHNFHFGPLIRTVIRCFSQSGFAKGKWRLYGGAGIILSRGLVESLSPKIVPYFRELDSKETTGKKKRHGPGAYEPIASGKRRLFAVSGGPTHPQTIRDRERRLASNAGASRRSLALSVLEQYYRHKHFSWMSHFPNLFKVQASRSIRWWECIRSPPAFI